MLLRVVFVVWPMWDRVKHWIIWWDFSRVMIACNALLWQLLVLVGAT